MKENRTIEKLDLDDRSTKEYLKNNPEAATQLGQTLISLEKQKEKSSGLFKAIQALGQHTNSLGFSTADKNYSANKNLVLAVILLILLLAMTIIIYFNVFYY